MRICRTAVEVQFLPPSRDPSRDPCTPISIYTLHFSKFRWLSRKCMCVWFLVKAPHSTNHRELTCRPDRAATQTGACGSRLGANCKCTALLTTRPRHGEPLRSTHQPRMSLVHVLATPTQNPEPRSHSHSHALGHMATCSLIPGSRRPSWPVARRQFSLDTAT